MDTPPNDPRNAPDWERKTLEKLAFAALSEQKARRRWGIFFKLVGFAYLAAVLVAVMDWAPSSEPASSERHTALINVYGAIEAKGEVSADKINAALQSAFEDKNTAGVLLRINSPGGSPVQSGIIFDEMRRLKAKHPDIPLYAVVEDLCASGGYYIAAGADKIYVNKASIVGSIGVLMNGFGFTGAMEKLGVERRLLTAGENKGFLDPFSPVNPAQKAHVEAMLGAIHQQFIDVVKLGRGKRLQETPDMFSGLVWTGEQSIKLGLADELGTVDSVARDVIKAEKLVDYSVKENLAERFAKRLGADAASGFGRGLVESLGMKAQ
ncbi:S49 family peptidase [Azovibrio restrictus]|uniref:S49 family peptidase n=1 Tax=Azovibrio restrictus TaxID=146938 RepID=UPI0003FAE774|nr:S49 family peptidase [Azovibrio restrictus]MCE1169839.1 S49 family peptidase [Azovibrio sp.]MDD3483311.1 S49 family peptidase [Azovibrio restrictus]